ncbi:MAG: EAL domain-containing protein [Oscillospiraceae bacterium]|nr:EAL domain-containing protein [Oscillospiraceae bacterium]
MKWTYIIYLLVSAVLMFIGLLYTFIKPKKFSFEPPLRMLFLFGGLAVAMHGFAMMTESVSAAYALFGGYYAAIDLMMLGMVSFGRKYTNIRQYNKKSQIALTVLADIDFLMMIVNCFRHVVFDCELVQDRGQQWFYYVGDKHPLYWYHVGFIYLTGFILLVDLIRKTIVVPRIYKSKYAVILVQCCLFAIVHTAYLYTDILHLRMRIDYSLMWIVIIAYAIVYFSIFYVPSGLTSKLLNATVSNMQNGIVCLDVENHCIHANEAARVYCEDRIEKQVSYWYENQLAIDETEKHWKVSQKLAGETLYYEIEYKKMFDRDKKSIGSFFIIHDCTEETKRLEAEKYRATHDSLTGIYNKETFYEKTRTMIRENPETEYCIVCTDVKNFKIVNDVFGVETGDKLLIRIANSIRFMSKNGWIYGRLTGDRFAVCLPREEFSEKQFLQETSRMAKMSENYMFKIQIHVGVYMIEDRTLRISVMCDRANLAIKTIKGSYESTVVYYKENLREDFLNEQRIISEFEMAIRSKQFQPYIQPQVFSQNGRCEGGEVLVRWIHPQTGMIPPYKFIPIFEQTGLIGKLDAYMWEMACQKLQEWQRRGLTNQYLSVNISQKDFYLMDVYETVTSLVEKYQIPPKSLHLEITETAVMDNPGEQLPLISKLREYGFMIEIDDFGSGYSSLNTLKDLSADVLKIDMGFLRKTEHQERSKIILKMIISLAKSLSMEVITEGVETQEQVDFLKEYGCDIFQGYHFAKPMPVQDFEEKHLNKTVEV